PLDGRRRRAGASQRRQRTRCRSQEDTPSCRRSRARQALSNDEGVGDVAQHVPRADLAGPIVVARAEQLIRTLGLDSHPEGGFYRETYRSVSRVRPDDERSSRAALTTIYFLLPAGSYSRWHQVRSDEAWHFYEGDGIELVIAPPSCDTVHRFIL